MLTNKVKIKQTHSVKYRDIIHNKRIKPVITILKSGESRLSGNNFHIFEKCMGENQYFLTYIFLIDYISNQEKLKKKNFYRIRFV